MSQTVKYRFKRMADLLDGLPTLSDSSSRSLGGRLVTEDLSGGCTLTVGLHANLYVPGLFFSLLLVCATVNLALCFGFTFSTLGCALMIVAFLPHLKRLAAAWVRGATRARRSATARQSALAHGAVFLLASVKHCKCISSSLSQNEG